MSKKFVLNRSQATLMTAIALASIGAVAQAAEVAIPDTKITASLRSSFTNVKSGGATTNDFTLNSFNVYLSSKITENIKFSFSSEIPGNDDITVKVQDAIAQFEYSPTFNIWAGRFLAPTDRANSYGPYFANNWNVFTDKVQDGYPSMYMGRVNGVAYWGDFADNKLKLSAGVFDAPSTTGTAAKTATTDPKKTMTAARVQYDFWDAEPGYYLNGTYYGDKDILALAAGTNMIGGDKTSNVDFLLEKKLGGAGVVTLESEYIKYDGLADSPVMKGNGYFVLGSYLMPQPIGIGKIQLLGKFGSTKVEGTPTTTTAYSNYGVDPNTGMIVPATTVTTTSTPADYDYDTTEINLNYIVKSFNTRFSLFYLKNSPSNGSDTKTIGLGVQLMTL